ncbi:EAL domain-containing protein [Pseudoalteromonas fenneropenaei]|uniref:EAL domain-containing protein n=1 Tax=Pseudoalteromonas fenneropenaei TaxID=1737459 RepID=A0ABV7CK89_9GAMM
MAALTCGWYFVNVTLYQVAHEALHQRGVSLVQQIAQRGLRAERDEDQIKINVLLKEQGFSLASQANERNQWFFSELESEVFQAKELTLRLAHPSVGLYYGHWFVVLNGSLLVLLMLVATRLRPRVTTPPSVKAPELNNLEAKSQSTPLVTFKPTSYPLPNSTPHHFAAFALVRWQCALPAQLDTAMHFNVVLKKRFVKNLRCSIKYLRSGVLAVTITEPSQAEVQHAASHLHEFIYQALLAFRGDLSRSAVKVGVCIHPLSAESAKVCQCARSALAMASDNPWQHQHEMVFSHTHKALQESAKQVFNYIKEGRYVLFFQPLFGFEQQDIIASEVLLRVRHAELGMLVARQFMPYLKEPEQFMELDKHVIKQTLKLLANERQPQKVSVNVHCINWCNRGFRRWLVETLGQSTLAEHLTFEISAADFYQYNVQLHSFFCILADLGCGVVVDHIERALQLAKFRGKVGLRALKLGVNLVQEIEHDQHKQRVIRDILAQAKALELPLYAVGVETPSALRCLQKLGLKGAQGHYFSEAMLQFAASDLKSGHDT